MKARSRPPFSKNGRFHAVVPAKLAQALEAPVVAALADGRVVVAVRADRAASLERIDPKTKISAAVSTDAPYGHYLIVFHSDVAPDEADRVLLDLGLARIEHPDLLPSQRLVDAGESALVELSERDEVAYIFPASEELATGAPVFGCVGPLMDGGPVAQYVSTVGTGWDGEGKGAVELTYSVGATSDRLPREQLLALIRRAAEEWARHASLRFSPTEEFSAARNLHFLFASGDHGDGYPFDGKGRVLAHTFYPAGVNPEPLAGDIHFDADELWAAGGQPDLYSVILHEMGHALGLGHSDRPGSVMYPYYRLLTTPQADDISALQRLYAPAPSTPLQPAPQPGPSSPPPAPAPQPSPARDTVAPSLAITTPATTVWSTSAERARIAGTARDAVGVTTVWWQRGADTGVATGTTNWWFDLPLFKGTNTVIVRARDAAGNTAWRTVIITRR